MLLLVVGRNQDLPRMLSLDVVLLLPRMLLSLAQNHFVVHHSDRSITGRPWRPR